MHYWSLITALLGNGQKFKIQTKYYFKKQAIFRFVSFLLVNSFLDVYIGFC